MKAEVAGRSLRLQPLWARVDANRTKLTIFVALFVSGSAVLLTAALVATPGALIGLVFADEFGDYWRGLALVVGIALMVLLVVGGLLSAVQLSNAEDWVRNRFGGRDLGEGEGRELRRVTADMAIAAGLPEPPAILVLTTDSQNAFAIGTVRKRATIGITEGMLADYSPEELRAVIATLTARIVAGDIMFGTALAALMGPIRAVRESRHVAGGAANGCADTGCGDPGCTLGGFDGCADAGSGCLDLGADDSGCAGAIAMVVFAAVVIAVTYVAVVTAAWIVTLWGRALNRASYEKADAEGMLLLKDPISMISALRKAIRSSTLVADGDQSYDGIFYAPTSGTPRVERAERRRFTRLCEVLGVEGLQATLGE
ncbi:MAG: M48 family metalloprotease [Coriobacteriia bacterium]|nr:M48 family metalloprotease [Coriobacteriia bacterium]